MRKSYLTLILICTLSYMCTTPAMANPQLEEQLDAVQSFLKADPYSEAYARTRANLITNLATLTDNPATVQSIVKLLDVEDWWIQAKALQTLARWGTSVSYLVPVLDQRLMSLSPECQYWALQALAQMGDAALPILERTLSSSDPRLKGYAITAIGEWWLKHHSEASSAQSSEVYKQLLQELEAALSSTSPVYLEAVFTLTKMEQPGKAILAAYLSHPVQLVRDTIVVELAKEENANEIFNEALARGGKAQEQALKGYLLLEKKPVTLVHELSKALHSNNLTMQQYAIYNLVAIGAESANAYPELFALLHRTSDELLMLDILQAVDKIGVAKKEHLGVLVQKLKHKNIAIRTAVVRLLGQWGHEAGGAVNLLENLLMSLQIETPENDGHGNRFVTPETVLAEEVVQALGKIGSPSVPVLTRLLNHPLYHIQNEAILALGQIGPSAAKTVPLLLKRLEESEDFYSREPYALSQMGDEAAKAIQQYIIQAKKDGSPEKDKVLRRLEWMEDAALPTLKELILNSKGKVERDIFIRLHNLSQKTTIKASEYAPILVKSLALEWEGYTPHQIFSWIGPDSIPYLVEALDDPNPKVRAGVILGLGGLGSKACSTYPGLHKLEKDPSPIVRAAVAEAYGLMGLENTVPRLVQLLTDPTKEAQSAALTALYRLPEHAEPAVPHLIQMLKNSTDAKQIGNIISILGVVKPAEPQITMLLLEKSPLLGDELYSNLKLLGHTAREAIPYLTDQLSKVTEVNDKRNILRTLHAVGMDKKLLAPLIFQQLETKDSHGEEWAPYLFELLDIDRFILRDGVTKAELLQYKLYTQKDIEHFIGQKKLIELENPDVKIRDKALFYLSDRSLFPEKVIPLLTVGVERWSHQGNLTIDYIEALGKYGSASIEALPSLLRCADQDSDYNVSNASLTTIAQLGPQILPLLRQRLASPDPSIQKRTIQIATQMGKEAETLIPEIIRIYRGKEVIGQQGTELSWAAYKFLNEHPARSKDILPFIMGAELSVITNLNDYQRMITGFPKVGQGDQKLITLWIAISLGSEQSYEKTHPVEALGGSGETAKRALPLIYSLALDKYPTLRGTAYKVISLIEPDHEKCFAYLKERVNCVYEVTNVQDDRGEIVSMEEALAQWGAIGALAPLAMRVQSEELYAEIIHFLFSMASPGWMSMQQMASREVLTYLYENDPRIQPYIRLHIGERNLYEWMMYNTIWT